MAGGDVRGTRDDWTTGPPKAQWPIATTLWKGIETRPGPLARKPTSRVSLCDTTRQSSPSTKRTNPRPPGSPAPIRRLRRADHHGGHGDAHLSPLPPFVHIFFSLWGPVGGGGLARTHGAFPEGPTSYHCCPRHRRVTCTAARRSAMRRGGHSSIEGSRERMMRHLCICLRSAALHCTSRHHHLGRTDQTTPLDVSRCLPWASGCGTATTQIGPALQTHASEPERDHLESVVSAAHQQTWQLAARATATAAGGCSRAEQESGQLSISSVF